MAESQRLEDFSVDKLFEWFNQETSEIQHQILSVKAQKGQDDQKSLAQLCQQRLNELSDKVRNAMAEIPAHDQRIYMGKITMLQKGLNDAYDDPARRRKFAFKSASQRTVPEKTLSSATASNGHMEPSKPTSAMKEKLKSSNANGYKSSEREVISITPEIRGLFCKVYQKGRLTLTPSPDFPSGSGNVSNVIESIVDIKASPTMDTTIPSLRLQDIQKSVVICTRVDGPVHITNAQNSIIVTSSKQFRMHDSQHCVVYLSTSSRPIIENCHFIRFAPLHRLLDQDVNMESDGVKRDMWNQVDDFNWHQTGHSPNWGIMEREDETKQDVFKRLLDEEDKSSVEEIWAILKLP